MTPTRGLFLVLEGIDGAGTTTQSARLAEVLRARGHTVHVTREPSTGPVGRLLRDALTRRLVEENGASTSFDETTFALLFAADRADHVAREIEPRLARGEIVISDRYDLSSLVYQSATWRGPEPREVVVGWIRALNERAPRPDLTFVLDIDAAIAGARRRARGGPAELFEDDELQVRLARGYAEPHLYRPEDAFVVLSADQPIEVLTEMLVRELDAHHAVSRSSAAP